MVDTAGQRRQEVMPRPAQSRSIGDMLTRPRLFELLDAAAAPVILLHAPAGYGKTTLAKQWTLSRELECFWYGAHAASSDYVVLCRELIARFRECVQTPVETC